MQEHDSHSKSFRCCQSYLLLALVISLMLQMGTFIIEVGFSLSNIASESHSWHIIYLVGIIALFLTSFPLSIVGIKGTTNETHFCVVLFAFGILVTYGIKVTLHVLFIDYRLAILLGINVIVNTIAFILALIFARKLKTEIKDEPLNDPMQAFH